MLSLKSVSAVSPCCPAALAGWCVELQREELGLHLWISAGCSQLWEGASAKLQSSSNVSWLLIWLGFRHSCFQGVAIAKVRFLPSVLRFYPLEFLNSFQKCQPRPRQSDLSGSSARSPAGLVQPCCNPGVGFVCPVLWGCTADPQLCQPGFPGLSRHFCLILQRQRTLIALQVQWIVEVYIKYCL